VGILDSKKKIVKNAIKKDETEKKKKKDPFSTSEEECSPLPEIIIKRKGARENVLQAKRPFQKAP